MTHTSEFALYEYLSKYDIVVNVPDLRIYPRNEWDTEDLIVTVSSGKTYHLNVKSTKHFGHLLLLEEGDYNSNGIYTPDNSQSDFYVLVRFQFDLENKLKSMGQLYSQKLMKEKNLKQLINEVIGEVDLKNKFYGKKNTKIYYDIPGYITHRDLVQVINNNFLIKQGDYLRTVKIDADNYYIQSGDLRSIGNLIN